MSPMKTIRRIALWAVASAVLTTLLVLGGLQVIDHFVTAPRTNRLQDAVEQSEQNGRAIKEQTDRACEFYVATADALVSLTDSPTLTVEQRRALTRMRAVARECRQEDTP